MKAVEQEEQQQAGPQRIADVDRQPAREQPREVAVTEAREPLAQGPDLPRSGRLCGRGRIGKQNGTERADDGEDAGEHQVAHQHPEL